MFEINRIPVIQNRLYISCIKRRLLLNSRYVTHHTRGWRLCWLGTIRRPFLTDSSASNSALIQYVIPEGDSLYLFLNKNAEQAQDMLTPSRRSSYYRSNLRDPEYVSVLIS